MLTEIVLIGTAAAVASVPVFFMDKATTGAEKLMRWSASLLRQDMKSYCSLETIFNEHTLVRKSGGMVSYLRLSGSMSVVVQEEYAASISHIHGMFASHMRDGGHDLQLVFKQDTESSGRVVSNAFAPIYATANRIGLDIQDLLDDEVKTISAIITSEDCWLIASTNPKAIDARIMESIRTETAKKLKDLNLPKMGEAMNPQVIIADLHARHESFVESVQDALATCGFRSNLMDAHEALAATKLEIDPDTSPLWQPSLPGDRLPTDVRHLPKDDWGDLFYPPLWSQLLSKEVLTAGGGINDESVVMGGTHYGTVSMEIPPQSPEAFSTMMRRLKDVPMRISFRIYANGLDMVKFNKSVVGLFSIFPKSFNRRIKNAMDLLESWGKKGNPAMGVAISATTWGKDAKSLSRRMQSMSRAIQGWGSTDISTRCGDPMDMFASTLPGLSSDCPGRIMLFPASEIAAILPLERIASPWDDGAVLLTSMDGKLMPFQTGSGLQDTWVILIFAPPGKGKSSWLLTLELATCLAPGLSQLPLMTVIDVGESVSGLISLLQSGLPPSRQHEAGYFKIMMHPDYAVNVMDTQLGLRMPMAPERDFIVAFLSMLATPAGRDKANDSIYEMFGLVVDETYKKYSDAGTSPKRYIPNVDAAVDQKIEEAGIDIDSDSSWWEITDALFRKGFVAEAGLAQRHAVPLISDIPSLLNSPQIADIYGDVKIADTGESLTKFASRMISAALRDYVIFGAPTKWDLSSCRVAGIDLNEVRGQGESGKKQTALMYAFAQNVSARNYYLKKETLLHLCPEIYKKFHEKRIADVESELKTIAYDEFHNTGGNDALRKIVGLNIREGRKWNIQVMLSSQLLDDFDTDMIENASSIFVLAAENAVTVNKCRTIFGLSDSAVAALEKYVHSPGIFLSIQNTKKGKSVHVLRNTLSPIKLWGFTTTAEDKVVRRLLYEAMPPSEARRVLALKFPKSGMFKAYIERKRRGMISGDDDGNVIASVAAEMIEAWATEKENGRKH